MIYHVYYFSATGNTWHAVTRIQRALEEAGHVVRAVSINSWSRPLPEKPDRMVVAFPTLAFAPPALVIRFLRRLSPSPTRTAVFTSDAGGCFDAPSRAARILRRRGFDVFLTGAASYSENWLQVCSGPDSETKARETERGDCMTDLFAARLIAEEEHLHATDRPVLSLLLHALGSLFILVGRRGLGKVFIADQNCNSCRLCQRQCPVGAIVMGSRRDARPYWKLTCESCNRCVNTCPTGAINDSILRSIVMLTLIIAVCVGGIGAYFRVIAPQVAEFAGQWSVLVHTAAIVAVAIVAHLLPLGPLDRFLLWPLQRVPVVGKLLEMSYSKHFRRYRMDGYKPPLEQGNPGERG